MSRLLRSLGAAAPAYASARDLLDDERRRNAVCFLLDIQLPGMNGFELAQG